ncbi:sugar transferase [Robiginitalea sp. M366]|uniref:sugar transferase n=1 Tax=Robiginitalea aestuariiviva TaxID=3036903 RepID=UPI00240D8DBB|nr:sugar transferase [Robiginitalea aestuariiviva]MDG1572725.1 sugar transferase [Robiginitalea aestuariiviva]
MEYRHLKRLMDFGFALLGLLVFLPILLILTLLLLVANRGKPFFLQPRPGKDEKIFRIFKFKTMNDRTDAQGELLPYEQRITPVGAFIRKFSLDEIPQLINVLKGDMSLVGPRPLLTVYLERYDDFQRRRHEVKPGITGWAQVNGRNAITWSEKFALDVWYVEYQSFLLDLKILFRTARKVLIREGVNSAENLNMPEFMGTGDE